MRYFISALMMLLASCAAHANESILESHWALDTVGSPSRAVFRKWVELKCGAGNEDMCTQACGQPDQCALREGYCRNCAGTALLYVKDLLDNLGEVYVKVDDTERLNDEWVGAYLRRGAFVSLTSDTVYNYVSSFNSPDLQRKFQSLCPGSTMMPLVFLGVDARTRAVGAADFVVCRENTGRLAAYPIRKNEAIRLAAPHPLP